MELPIARLIRDVYAAIQAALEEDIRPLGVTPAQYGVLRRIEESPGSSSAQLARRVYVSPQSMHEIVKQLEHNGWVHRTPHPELGRVLQNHPTPAGQTLLDHCNERAFALNDQVTADLATVERSQFAALLQRAMANLERQRKHDGS